MTKVGRELDAYVVLFVPVVKRRMDDEVRPGPLVLTWQRMDRTIRSRKTDRAAYIAPNLELALFGRTGYYSRWNCTTSSSVERGGVTATIEAMEWLALERDPKSDSPKGTVFAMIHMSMQRSTWDELNAFVSEVVDLNPLYRPRWRDEVANLVGPLLPDVRRAFALVGLRWPQGDLDRTSKHLSTLAHLGRHPTPDLLTHSSLVSVATSGDTHAAVNRFGVFYAQYGAHAEEDVEETAGFFFRLRTAIADCVLLGQGQREILTRLERQFAVSMTGRLTLGELRNVAESLNEFERIWWSTEYADQGPYTLILQACQEKFNLTDRLLSLRERIGQAGAIRTASAVEALTIVNMIVATLAIVVPTLVAVWAAEPAVSRGSVWTLLLRVALVAGTLILLGCTLGWMALRRWRH